MSDTVQVTLSRDDWEGIMRLTERSAQIAAQSAEDAEDYDPDEGPDEAWIEGRHRGAAAARELADRVRQQVEEGSSGGRTDV